MIANLAALKGSAPLVKASPGHSEMCVFGARGCLSWSPPLPSLPFSAVGLLLSTPSCRVELRFLIILLLLQPAPAAPPCLSHRFPGSHVEGERERERETRIGSRSATVRGERAERSRRRRRRRAGEGRGEALPSV